MDDLRRFKDSARVIQDYCLSMSTEECNGGGCKYTDDKGGCVFDFLGTPDMWRLGRLDDAKSANSTK